MVVVYLQSCSVVSTRLFLGSSCWHYEPCIFLHLFRMSCMEELGRLKMLDKSHLCLVGTAALSTLKPSAQLKIEAPFWHWLKINHQLVTSRTLACFETSCWINELIFEWNYQWRSTRSIILHIPTLYMKRSHAVLDWQHGGIQKKIINFSKYHVSKDDIVVRLPIMHVAYHKPIYANEDFLKSGKVVQLLWRFDRLYLKKKCMDSVQICNKASRDYKLYCSWLTLSGSM